MKKEQTWWYRAWFNKDVGNRLLNIIKKILKTCFVIIWVRWIFSLIYVLWSTRIQTDLGMSVLWTFLWWDNFNNRYLEGRLGAWTDKIKLDTIKDLPIGQEIMLEPQSHNVTYYKIPKVGSATYDLELHVKWPVAWHYEDYMIWNGPLDVKYHYNLNSVYRGSFEDDTEKCYLIRWRPRSNYRYDWKEFFDWENPNNCETIIFHHLDWDLEIEGYFRFVTPSNDINNGKIRAEYRKVDWNRNE